MRYAFCAVHSRVVKVHPCTNRRKCARNDASDAGTKRQTVTTRDQRLQVRPLVKLQGLQIKVIDKTEVPLVGKHCEFVQFSNRACVEQASAWLNGTQLGAPGIRLSWGRSPSNKQAQPNQA